MHKSAGFLAIAVSMMLMHPVEGWGTVQKNEEGICCGETPHPMRVTARHIEANGIGYNQGYTTVEGFFPLYDAYDSWICFLDARAHVFNDGQPAASGGLGYRFLTDSYVWGANLYYDYRKTSRQHYNQVAAGLEWLSEQWDVRLNGYLPVGEKRSHLYETKFDKFKGHEAILRSKYQYALAGANAEVGYHLDHWKDYPLYFTVGPYYLTGKGGTAWGGQFRARVQIYDYLTIEGNTSYDNLFKWVGQGQVGVTVPFGPRKTVRKNKCQSDCSKPLALAARFYQPVDRFEIVPVDTKHKHSVAIDPLTGDPWFFIFVNNTSHSAGTFESPYPTLGQAEANSGPHNVIYVYPGDGTTTGMDQGITLQDYQKLWGSGVVQNLPTTRGKVKIPAQTFGTFIGDTVLPNITNTSDVVTLANNNEISGLFLQTQGLFSCIKGSNVTDLNVLNSTLAGINAPGFIGISGTEIAGTVNVSGCTFNQGSSTAGSAAIVLQNSLGTPTLFLSNSQINFSATDSSTTPAVHWTLSKRPTATLTAQNNTIISTTAAMEVDISGATTLIAELSNNQITAGAYGLFVNSTSGSTIIDATLENNTINTFALNGMTTFNQSVYFVQMGGLSATLRGNTLISNSYPFELDSNVGSTEATVLFENNNITSLNEDTLFDYIYFNQLDGNVTATFNNNILNTGIFSNITAGNHIFTASRNTVAGHASGITLDLGAGSLNAMITDNNISASSGVTVFQTTGASTVTIADNTISVQKDTSSGDAVAVSIGQEGGPLTATIVGNTISAYKNFGTAISMSEIDVMGQPAGPFNVTIAGNTLNAYYGVSIALQTVPFTSTITGNTIKTQQAILQTALPGPIHTTITGNTIDASTAMILDQTANTGGPCVATINDNTISSQFGVSIGNIGGSPGDFIITMNNNIIEAYQDDAVFLGIANSNSSLSMTGNSLTGGFDDYALKLSSTNSTFNASLVDNFITGYFPANFLFSGGTTTLGMTGNTVKGPNSVLIDLTHGTFNGVIQGNIFDGVGDAFDLETTTSTMPLSNITLDITGNTITAAGGSGISLSGPGFSNMTANLTATIANNNFNATSEAVSFTSETGTYLLNLQSNTLSNGAGFFLSSAGTTATWNVIGNNFAALNSNPVDAEVRGGTACMTLNNNTAYPFPNAYRLLQTGGTFILNTPQNNIGQVVPTGTITPGPCP